MDTLKGYLIQVICAAIICGIAAAFIPEKSAFNKLIRMICGVYLCICVISPVVKLRLADFSSYMEEFDINTSVIVDQGKEIADSQTAAIIKSNTESYILEKASAMGLSIDVEVTVSDSIPQIPYKITITGTSSPANRQRFQNWLETELDIEKEHQEWK